MGAVEIKTFRIHRRWKYRHSSRDYREYGPLISWNVITVGEQTRDRKKATGNLSLNTSTRWLFNYVWLYIWTAWQDSYNHKFTIQSTSWLMMAFSYVCPSWRFASKVDKTWYRMFCCVTEKYRVQRDCDMPALVSLINAVVKLLSKQEKDWVYCCSENVYLSNCPRSRCSFNSRNILVSCDVHQVVPLRAFATRIFILIIKIQTLHCVISINFAIILPTLACYHHTLDRVSHSGIFADITRDAWSRCFHPKQQAETHGVTTPASHVRSEWRQHIWGLVPNHLW